VAGALSLAAWVYLEERGCSVVVRSSSSAALGLGLLTWRAYVA
jgi:hypothetical protein